MPNFDFEHETDQDFERFRLANDYTMRHLAEHLHSAGLRDRLIRLLVGNNAWMEAKTQAFSKSLWQTLGL